jgi:hypothetical protein
MGKQMSTMKREVAGWSSVVSDDLVQTVDQNICERRHNTISELSCEFPQISRAILYKVIMVMLRYQNIYKVYAIKSFHNMGSKNAHGCTKNAEYGFSFDVFYSNVPKMTMNFSITSYE